MNFANWMEGVCGVPAWLCLTVIVVVCAAVILTVAGWQQERRERSRSRVIRLR